MRKTNEMDMLVETCKTSLVLKAVLGILCFPLAIMVYRLGEATYTLFQVKGFMIESLALVIIIAGGILISKPIEYFLSMLSGESEVEFFVEEEDYEDVE